MSTQCRAVRLYLFLGEVLAAAVAYDARQM